MNSVTQRAAIKTFFKKWNGIGDEKQDTQSYWIELLSNIYGIQDVTNCISFEKRVKIDGNTKYIDGYIKDTLVLIEQKSFGIDLDKPEKQSDGAMLTPYQQGKRYSDNLPFNEKPRWIITCNFQEFHIHDMNKPNEAPEVLYLKDLEKEYYRLSFLVNIKDENLQKEMEVSMKAGEIVGILYDKIKEQYFDAENEKTLKSLNIFCVRLVFCLYAEDAGIFGRKNMFHDYIASYDAKGLRNAFIELFKALDTKIEDRDKYLDDDLAEFPYVNGGLFADEEIEIPKLTEEIKTLILTEASQDFDWSEISPTIFGAVFESTLNPETRRRGGMHYTSIENIHKVIDSLFLDDLKNELQEIKLIAVNKTKIDKLDAFQKKIAELKFLDPACGSGNFLTESYLSLRKIENEIISLRVEASKSQLTGQIMLGGLTGEANPIKVSIGQFYGIEINDFAVTVAKTALWIAESQMIKRTEDIIHTSIDFLPLKSYANIVEGNALRLNWEDVVQKSELSFIMGNPPFIGFTYMSDEQKKDMQNIFPGVKNLDFVSAWYKIASDYIQDTIIQCGFVSTNSITQGETVARLWQFLNIKINFAYRTFIWNSEAKLKAQVHCVIIGFSTFDCKEKWLFDNGRKNRASNINAYLCDAPDIIVTSRNKPLHNISKMVYGNKPADGGHLIIEVDEYEEFIKKEPQAQKFIRPLLGAVEYLHGKKRWCLWLKGVSPSELKQCPLIMDRIKQCKLTRENSIAAGIRKFASTPTLFAQITQPDGENYIIIPRVSSERRKYVPMGFLDGNTIVTDAVQIVPNASLFEFGILTSNVHMAWMRAVAGRLKSDYRYSKDIVYNNFPWVTPTEVQRSKIEATAQAILDARALYPNDNLANLYDPDTMPAELVKAHQANDRAVLQAYGFPTSGLKFGEADCVAELMKMYQKLTE